MMSPPYLEESTSASSMLKNTSECRLIKKVQMQGGDPSAGFAGATVGGRFGRGPSRPPPRKAFAADGPFSSAC